MDVFGIAVTQSGDYLRAAAIAAAHDLDLFAALATPPSRDERGSLAAPRSLDELADAIGVRRGRHRLRALLDVLVALGILERRATGFATNVAPPRPDVPADGWGRIAEVIRRDRPLDVAGGDTERRFHRHLARAGAEPARELAALLAATSVGLGGGGGGGASAMLDIGGGDGGASAMLDTGGGGASASAVLDIGGGAGAYTRAVLERDPAARVTLVDFGDVLELAREELGPLAARVTFVGGDARVAPVGDGYGAALLCNVLHLHGPPIARGLVAAAARAVAPGGLVAIKDLEVADDRSGPLAGLLFALNMAVFTGEGDVHAPAQLRGWLAEAGVVDVGLHRLAAAPDAIVLIGRRP